MFAKRKKNFWPPNQIASASFDKRGDSRSDLTVKKNLFVGKKEHPEFFR